MTFKYKNAIEVYEVMEKMNEYLEKMGKENNNIPIMIEIYNYIKNSLPIFYSDGELNYYYGRIIGLIMSCESKLPPKFITESEPLFNYNDDDFIEKNQKDEMILDKIVLKTRKELLKYYKISNPDTEIKNISFTNYCSKSSRIVSQICNDNDIKSTRLEIHPGFSKKDNLCNGSCFHYFNIINYNKKYYLIDCTYRQFFKIKHNFLEKIGLLNMQGCHPGTFMLIDSEREKVARKILRDGWIELDENTLKLFLDGFAISYRNGIYYEETNDYSFNTKYTTDDYIRFLKEEDNQINHEGKEALGYQKRIIKK